MPDSSCLVLPSPLLGPAAYRPLAESLTTLGRPTQVARLPRSPLTPGRVLRGYTQAATAHGAVVLVAHSNAGFLAPAVAEACGAVATVFLDAALPEVEATSTTLASAEMAAWLDGLVDDAGLLPPWTRWWPEEEVAALFPAPEARAEVEAGQPRMPLAWFRGVVPVPAGWSTRPSAYLAFGDTYAAELAVARRAGWPVVAVEGTHLHWWADPASVAAEVVRLADSLARRG